MENSKWGSGVGHKIGANISLHNQDICAFESEGFSLSVNTLLTKRDDAIF